MLKSVHGLASVGSWLISFRRMKSIVGQHFSLFVGQHPFFRLGAVSFSFGCRQTNKSMLTKDFAVSAKEGD